MGISELGRGLVLASLAFATMGMVIGAVAGARKTEQAMRLTRWCAYGFGATSILAALLMEYALLTHDFSVQYVAEVGSLDTPTLFTVVSLWASLNGSILFWAAVLGAYVIALAWFYRDKHREYMPYTLSVLMAICVFFALLVASIANPFAPVSPVPLDGPGPNPLLQNHLLMAVHPPTLYLGYVGMAVPFAMGCGALLAGRLEAGWMAPLRRWMLIPWAFLTLAIMLGGWWSYEVLGWGGYWAWDPVENASFLPWLTATAFLHSAMVVERRGTLKTWSIVLLMASFLLTLVGTFMTRSGVFNSVHSFTQSDIGPTFLVFIAVCLVGSVLLLAFREHVLHADVPSPRGPHLLSREVAILAQNLAFTVFTFTVLLGTLYPLIAEQWDGTRVSVGEPFFERMALPLGIIIVLLMGIGPSLPWGRLNPTEAGKRFLPPFIAGIVTVVVSYSAGFTGPQSLLAFGVCAFAGWSSAREMLEPILARRASKGESFGQATITVISKAHRRYGGHVAHIGIVITTVAIALSAGYKVERDVTLRKGESVEMAGFTATFTGAELQKEPHRDSLVAFFELSYDGRDMGVQEPRLNYYKSMREPIGTPAVREGIAGDLYLSLMQVDKNGANASVRAMYTPGVGWLWVGVIIVSLGAVIAAVPARRRKTKSAPQRKSA